MFDLEFIKIIKMFLDFYENGIYTHYITYNSKKELENLKDKIDATYDPKITTNADFHKWIVNRYLIGNVKKYKQVKYLNKTTLPIIS